MGNMKRLLVFVIMTAFVFAAEAQNITKTLGSNGSFFIKSNSSNTILDISSGNFMLYNEGSSATKFQLHNAGSLFLELEFLKAGGNAATPSIVSNNDKLGIIKALGHTGSVYGNGAEIIFQVNTAYGSIDGSGVPTDIHFLTSEGSNGSPVTRLTIKGDGVVNISDLAGTYGGGQAYVVVNDAGDIIAQDLPPALARVKKEIRQLKEENAALRAELAELKALVMKSQ